MSEAGGHASPRPRSYTTRARHGPPLRSYTTRARHASPLRYLGKRGRISGEACCVAGGERPEVARYPSRAPRSAIRRWISTRERRIGGEGVVYAWRVAK